MRARVAEYAMLARPVQFRPMINALRRTIHGTRLHPALVARWRNRLPGEWCLDSILDLNRLPDVPSFSRALALEIVSREFRS
jgi:hypothetical protein